MKQLYTHLKLSLLAVICVLYTQAIAQTNGTITGTITTSDGKPASAVSVLLKELNKSTITSDNGSFVLKNVKPGTYTLKTAYIGLKPQEKQVSLMAGEKASVEFVLAENAQKLSDVVVTGYKTPNQRPVNLGKIGIAPKDLPQSVQIISSVVIADQQANLLSDVMKNVNGVAFGANRGGVSGETFYARGYSLGTNNVLKNGARTNTGGLPETSTLESVEVLKGSAALLYGGVTGGAVVNMVTKKPKFNYGGEVSLRSGSYDLYKPSGDIYGPITKDLAFRIVGTYEDAGSFRNNVGAKRTYVNPSLLYNLGKKTEILIQGDYLKSDYTPDFGIGTVNNTIVGSVGRSTFLNTQWAYNNTNTTTAQANITHKLNDKWKLNVIGSVLGYNRNYFSSERPTALSDGTWYRALTRSKTKEFTYNQQLNLNGAFKTGSLKHTILVGADADESFTTAYGFNETNKLSKTYIAPGTTTSATIKYYDEVNILNSSSYNVQTNMNMPETSVISDTKTPIYRMGTFIQDLVAVTDKFKVLAGIRYTFQKTPRSVVTNYATGVKTLSNNGINKSKTEDAFSPKLGLIYEPLKTTSIYVSYANNFTSNAGLDVSTNAPMAPSIIDQYEAGIKNDFLNGKLSANITWYKILNNKFAQTAVFKADGSTNSDSNLKEFTGETASDGIELDLNGTIVKGLNFIAGYSYNFMRYTKTREEVRKSDNSILVAGGFVEGERVVGTTKNTANGTLFYTFNSGQVRGLKLGASAFYTGDRNGGRNTNKSGTSTGIIPLKAFTTFDLSAGYTYRKLSLLGKIANITNELNYFVHENYSVNPIPPRQFITTLSYKF